MPTRPKGNPDGIRVSARAHHRSADLIATTHHKAALTFGAVSRATWTATVAATKGVTMFLFKRKPKEDEPVDMEARSPVTGLKYKDLALLGQMMKNGADLTKPRHVLFYLYFGSPESANGGAEDARMAGYACSVRDPSPAHPDQWSLVCERHDAVLDPDGVRSADDLFQGIADRLGGEFDGWEAAV